MFFIYNFISIIASQIVKILALFSPKMKLFVNGRKIVFSTLQSKINASDKTIWFHAASLGEYEQGLPVIEKVKIKYPSHKIIVTFFSPSGYEVRKNNTIADVTVYLPLDTKSNAKRFIELTHPEMVFFIKYEFWPNYLNELKQRGIKTYLISGIFRENQMFFKWYGSFYRSALKTFDYFFVQNEKSKNLIQSIGFSNVKISGDTRFDRVVAILERDNSLDFIDKFKNNKEEGIYHCYCCDLALFSSEHKFNSGTGWPSYFQVYEKRNVHIAIDSSLGMNREEVSCARCDDGIAASSVSS